MGFYENEKKEKEEDDDKTKLSPAWGVNFRTECSSGYTGK